jgi:hypothetical protein
VVAIKVSHCTTPLNFDMAAVTLTCAEVTSTSLAAVTVTLPAGALMVIPCVSILMLLPLA